MLLAIGDITGKKLLDIGCGSGIHAKAYCTRGADVTLVDCSETMLAMARTSCPGVPAHCTDAAHLPFEENVFDGVTASLVMHHIEEQEAALLGIARVLKPGGIFYFSDYSPVGLARERRITEQGVEYLLGHTRTADGTKVWGRTTDREGSIELIPGHSVIVYERMFGTHVKALTQTGFHLIDYHECWPTQELALHDPDAYAIMSKVPLFSIFASRKF